MPNSGRPAADAIAENFHNPRTPVAHQLRSLALLKTAAATAKAPPRRAGRRVQSLYFDCTVTRRPILGGFLSSGRLSEPRRPPNSERPRAPALSSVDSELTNIYPGRGLWRRRRLRRNAGPRWRLLSTRAVGLPVGEIDGRRTIFPQQWYPLVLEMATAWYKASQHGPDPPGWLNWQGVRTSQRPSLQYEL